MVSGPAMAPAAWPVAGSAAATQDEMRWRQLDSGVSAVSFGFVATAILVSMFLAMAILEHFLRGQARAHGMGPPFEPSPPRGGILSRLRFLLVRRRGGGGAAGFPGSDLEAARKLDGRASPEMPVYAKGVSCSSTLPPREDPVAIASAYSFCWFLVKSKLAAVYLTIQREGLQSAGDTPVFLSGYIAGPLAEFRRVTVETGYLHICTV